MNLKSFIAALLLVGLLAACTQRTCPTYTKDSVETTQPAPQDS